MALPVLLAGIGILAPGAAQALTAQDRAAAVGLNLTSITQGRNPVFDADDDGLADDVLLNTHNFGPSHLRRGASNGVFSVYLPGQFQKYDRHGCVAADFGAPGGGRPDGRDDLYCTIGACSGRGLSACKGRVFHKELWLQRAGGGFVNEGVAWDLSAPNDRGRDAVVVDVNRDGLPDLATAAEGSPNGGSMNRLFLNQGGRFAEVQNTPVRAVKGSECVATLLRQDRYPDLFFCADLGATRGLGVVTYRNNGGSFTEVSASQPYRFLAAMDIELTDVSGDRRPDLIITTMGKISVWRNVNDSFPYETFAHPVSQGRDAVACDVDRDGDQDLYVVTGKARGAQAQQPDLLLLNGGTGAAFTSFRGLPQTTQGEGDIATCMPHYPDGPAVLVTNGRWTSPGPNQFIVFPRSPS